MLAASLFLPLMVLAVDVPQLTKASNVQQLILSIINALMPLFLALAIFFLVLAGFKFITARGEPGKIKEAQQTFLWTLVGIACVVSGKIIVAVLLDILKKI